MKFLKTSDKENRLQVHKLKDALHKEGHDKKENRFLVRTMQAKR